MQYLRHLLGTRLLSVVLCVLFLVTTTPLMTGCGGGSSGSPPAVSDSCPTCSANPTTPAADPLPSTVVRVASFMAYKPDETTPTQFYAQDGTPITQAELSQALLALPKDPNKSVGIQIVNQKPPAPGTVKPQYVQVGCLWMDVRWENGPVGNCFKLAGVQWHLNFHFKNACNNHEYFNLHAKAWWDGGPQFGLYESTSGWCARGGVKYSDIRSKFMEALALVGVGGLAAYIISDVSAGVVVAAFAL